MYSFAQPVMDEELHLVSMHGLGYYEGTCILLTIMNLLDRSSASTQHCHIQWLTDSQSAVADLCKMRAGTPAMPHVVRQVLQLAVQPDIRVDWQWRLRDAPELQHADFLTKEPDPCTLSGKNRLHITAVVSGR